MIDPIKTAALSLNNLSVTFPNGNGGLEALRNIGFEVQPQEFLCVLGPSGCGKTTLLRVLAGLLQPTSGEITFHEHIGKLPETGFVFQNANLMPWRSVLQNITLPLELADAPRDEIQRKAANLIELVGLQGFEDNWPKDLSGGMAQRVALARALIHDPDLLLLDEPFGALDALTRDRMGTELLRIWQVRQKTVVMVTHSISEAVFLADRVLVLSSRPGTVNLDLKIDLPRPRAEEMRYSDHFGKLVKKIRESITA
jgi:NitT/TauT family transport system ATP-binding protein